MMSPAVEDTASKVMVAVLNWNGYDLTRACVRSLDQLETPPDWTVVVDNGSSEPDVRRLAADVGRDVQIIELERNGGVASGYNAAIRQALNLGASHILLLNNDTLVEDPLLLRRLIEAGGAGTACVGPVVLDRGGKVFSAGGRLEWPWGITHHLRRIRADTRDGPYDTDWVDGSCMLISLRAVCAIGGLDDSYFLYWEETDWCVRARKAGFRVLIEPRTSIVHLRGGSAASSTTEWYIARNGIRFVRRNGSAMYNVLALGRFILRDLPASAIGRGGRPRISVLVRALIWNLRDARDRGHWRLPPTGPALCRDGAETPHSR